MALKFAGLMGLGTMAIIVVCWLALLGLSGLPRARRRWPGLRTEIGMLGLLTVLFVLFFWRLLFERGVAIPKGGGDFNSFYYPLSAFAANQIQHGHFSLWNPYLYAGAPFAADYQAGALYPPNLVAWLIARPFTYDTFEGLMIAHIWWASVMAYLFGRVIGLRRAPALIAGLIFTYGGFMTAQLGHAPMIAVASWLPATLAALYLARHGSIGWTVIAGLCLTMATLAGHPQVLLYVLTAALAYGVYLAWAERPTVAQAMFLDGEGGAMISTPDPPALGQSAVGPLWLRNMRRSSGMYWVGAATRLALMLGVMIGLSAPLLLPAEQLSRRSVRAGIGYDEATQFSVQPVALLQLIVPKVFGDNPTNYWSTFASGEIWGYAGVGSLVLAVIGVLGRARARNGHKLFFVGLGALALLGALGPFTPLHGWLYGFVPGYDRVRAAGRLLLLYDLAVAVLAACGLDVLLDWLEARTAPLLDLGALLRQMRRGLMIVIAALGLGIIPLFYAVILSQNDPVNRPVIAVDGLNVLLLILLGALALVWAVERRGMGAGALAVLAVVLVALDLFSATIGFNPTTDNLRAGYQQAVAVYELQMREAAGPPFRIDTDDISDRWQPSLAAIAGIDSISGAYNPLQLADYATFRERAQSSRSSAIYGLLNVAYVGQPYEKPAPAGWQPAFSGTRVMFYQSPRPPLPRAFVVGAAQSVADPAAAFDRIKAPDFDPAKIVYIQGAVQPTAADPGASAATVTRDGTDGVTVQVMTRGAGYLVLSDAYFPDWRVTLDGRATTIYQADLAFRAVYLPDAGDHTLVFRFRPKWWTIGWGIAGLTAVGIVAVLAVPTLVRRRRR